MKKIILSGIFCLITAAFCSAQYTKLMDFNGTNGNGPLCTLINSGKVLYGTAANGGAYNKGLIFKIDTDGTGYKDLFDFNDTDGAQPIGTLTQVGEVLFGTTNYGGAHNKGVMFRMDTNGAGYKDMIDFNSSIEIPYCYLTSSGFILYGTSVVGGANGAGFIFKIDTDGTGLKDLFDFNGTNGWRPIGGLTLSAGILYGMTEDGGVYSSGNVYKIDTDGTGFKDLFDFNEFAYNGWDPLQGLTLSGEILYGMTTSGGLTWNGNIFKIDTDGTGFIDMHDFNEGNGPLPNGNLTLSGGILYGIAPASDANQGAIFKIDTNGTNCVNIHVFTGTEGVNPEFSLLLSGSAFYGVARDGGTYGDGVIFKYDTANISTDVNHLSANSGEWSIYPNPNNGIFTVSFSHPAAIAGSQTIRVYNVIGEEVYNGMLNPPAGGQHDYKLDLSNQPNGIYFLKAVTEDGETLTQKVSVVR
jgi:uncharacterized repeat protein (TIGR03803 family)